MDNTFMKQAQNFFNKIEEVNNKNNSASQQKKKKNKELTTSQHKKIKNKKIVFNNQMISSSLQFGDKENAMNIMNVLLLGQQDHDNDDHKMKQSQQCITTQENKLVLTNNEVDKSKINTNNENNKNEQQSLQSYLSNTLQTQYQTEISQIDHQLREENNLLMQKLKASEEKNQQLFKMLSDFKMAHGKQIQDLNKKYERSQREIDILKQECQIYKDQVKYYSQKYANLIKLDLLKNQKMINAQQIKNKQKDENKRQHTKQDIKRQQEQQQQQ